MAVVFAFRDEKFNDIHTKPDDIAAGRLSERGDPQMSTFSAQFRQPVLFHRGEPNKRKRKAGKVMEMLRKISTLDPLFRLGRSPSLSRCDEP